MNTRVLKEKGPYLANRPSNLPLDSIKQNTQISIKQGLEGNNESFEDIKKVLNDGKISFNSGLGALGPIWIIGEIGNLSRNELIEICYILKNSIMNKNPKHDTNLFHKIASVIEEKLFILGIDFSLEDVIYQEGGHSKSVKIPLPTKKDQI